MASLQKISNLVPTPENREKVIKRYQATDDIVKDLLYCFNHFNYQAAPCAALFSTGNSKDDARKIYDFIKSNFKYDAEPERVQTTRSFSRIIHDNTPIDCKHNALLASCIAWQMGYDVIFRFVSYTPGNSYGHVYVLIQRPGENEKYIIDPLQDFNYEKSYYSHKDYRAINDLKKNKMLSRLTGIGATPEKLGRNGLSVYVDGMGKITIFKNIATAIKKIAPKAGTVIKKVSLAPVRGAGLVLLDFNFRNFAGRLKKVAATNPTAFNNLVTLFGFDKTTLMNSVNKGAAKAPLLGGKTSGVGSVAVVTAAIVAASPMIVALLKVFKENNLTEPGDDTVGEDAGNDISKLPNSTLPTSDGGSFLDSIPAPVKYAGGAILLGGAAYGIKKMLKK